MTSNISKEPNIKSMPGTTANKRHSYSLETVLEEI